MTSKYRHIFFFTNFFHLKHSVTQTNPLVIRSIEVTLIPYVFKNWMDFLKFGIRYFKLKQHVRKNRRRRDLRASFLFDTLISKHKTENQIQNLIWIFQLFFRKLWTKQLLTYKEMIQFYRLDNNRKKNNSSDLKLAFECNDLVNTDFVLTKC